MRLLPSLKTCQHGLLSLVYAALCAGHSFAQDHKIEKNSTSKFYTGKENTSFIIGTASINTLIFSLSEQFCQIIAPKLKSQCQTHISAGSTQNVMDLSEKKIQMGYVSSPIYYHFKNKLPPFTDPKFKRNNLKALFSLHTVLVTHFTRADTGITTFDQVKNHPIDIGHEGSAINSILKKVWQEKNWTEQDFTRVQTFRGIHRAPALCRKKIDAYSFISYHPNEAFQKNIKRCKMRLIPFSETFIENMINKYPYFIKGEIPVKFYDLDNKTPIKSFGGIGLILVHENMDPERAYLITKVIFENFDHWKSTSITHTTLTKKLMSHRGLKPEQIHPGAMRYYQEIGLYPSK